MLSLGPFSLKSDYNQKYLICVDIKDGLLIFSGEKPASSPEDKFEVEMATKSENIGLVHLKSCYNNKYWRRLSPQDLSVVAAADKPEEDQSKWSCTLFKPIYLQDGATKVRLMHIQTGNYACCCQDSCLRVTAKDANTPESCYVFIITITGAVNNEQVITGVNSDLNDDKK